MAKDASGNQITTKGLWPSRIARWDDSHAGESRTSHFQTGAAEAKDDISLTPELKPTGPVRKHGEGQAGDPGRAGW